MTAPGSRAVVTRQDVETAQAVIDAWVKDRLDTADGDALSVPGAAYLRGLMTQALADAHALGYDEGVVRGRRLIAHTVRDALDGEGL